MEPLLGLMSMADAMAGIKDGSTVLIGGFGAVVLEPGDVQAVALFLRDPLAAEAPESPWLALVLPLAIPSYLAAYAFGEFLDFTGPVQTGYRALFGYTSSREYSFFDVKSLSGAVLVMSAVLYPYVYLACRSMFLMQGRAAADVARTLGASPFRVFWKIQVPMARPAIRSRASLSAASSPVTALTR